MIEFLMATRMGDKDTSVLDVVRITRKLDMHLIKMMK